MDGEIEHADDDSDADGDYEGIFTVELKGEIFSLMILFMEYGSDYLEAGEEALYAVAGNGLVTNRDECGIMGDDE